jgi:hypothetical protein
MTDNTATIASHSDVRKKLDVIRCGTVPNPNGKGERKRPAHLVNQDVLFTVHNHFESRGTMFQAPHPYYLDDEDHRLIHLSEDDPELAHLLLQLGLLPKEFHTTLVTRALIDMGRRAPSRTPHRISYMEDSAVYLRASPTLMIKVTTDAIEEVPIGTDDVILIADDLGDWPALSELQPHIDTLRPTVGTACTRLLPGLAFSDLLTSRWSHDSILTHEQAHQMFVTRVMFLSAASRYSLWPLDVHTGDGESGKTTPLELLLTTFKGRVSLTKSLPGKERDLVASVTNSSILAYDNIDEARLDSPDKAAYSDLICQISTGAELDLARLYSTNVVDRYTIKNHGFFTARTNPFSRPDVMRRTIHLEMDPPDTTSKFDRDKLVAKVLELRPQMLAEFLLRSQNILRAHLAHGDAAFEYQSSMAEYERFTLICAAYEGTLDETHKLWSDYMVQWQRSITASNPLVFGLRLWLGKGGNHDRTVSPATLFAELQTVYRETEQAFPYRSPAAFGRHVGQNLPALRAIGFTTVRTRSGQDYLFTPSEEASKALYHDLHVVAVKRSADQFLASYPSSSRYTPPKPDAAWDDQIAAFEEGLDPDNHTAPKKGPIQ